MSGDIAVRWIVPESQEQELVTAIEVNGGRVESVDGGYQPDGDAAMDYQAAGFEPLTMIMAVAPVVYAVSALAKLWRNRAVQGGVLVDTRGDAVDVRVVPTMQSGRLVVVDDSGTQVIDADDGDGAALLSAVLTSRAR
jgi:hypothetical protein